MTNAGDTSGYMAWYTSRSEPIQAVPGLDIGGASNLRSACRACRRPARGNRR